MDVRTMPNNRRRELIISKRGYVSIFGTEF
jgi:hypothetical protein